MDNVKKKWCREHLDKAFVDGLEATVCAFGKDEKYTHQDLVSLGVGNLRAARNLGRICRRLRVTSVAKLHALGPRPLLRTAGVGNATMWVAMHILDAAGYDVGPWWGWDDAETPKFSTYRERVRRKVQRKGARHEV